MLKTPKDSITLGEYSAAHNHVVLFWHGVGCPGGESVVIGHPDMDWADRRGLLDLSGTVDSRGSWRWDGHGRPTDDRGNTVLNVSASVNGPLWQELVEDYESAV